MSWIECNCGHLIMDISYNLPHKAYFLADQDVESALDDTISQVAEFIEARERGEQEHYFSEHALLLREPTLQSILKQKFNHPTFDVGRVMYECEACGRVWMQVKLDTNEWVSYLPESSKRGILRQDGTASDE